MATFTIPNGPNNSNRVVPEKEFINYWTDRFRSDPVMQQIFARARTMRGGEKDKEREATERARQMGWNPPDHDWSVDFDKNGFRTERANFMSRNADWIVPVAAGAATFGLGAMGVGPLAGVMGGSGSTAASAAAPAVVMGADGIPVITGTAIGSGMSAAAPTIAGASGIAAGSSGGFLSQVGNLARNPKVLEGAGRMISGAGQASASNRGAETAARLDRDRISLDAERLYQDTLLAREQDQRKARSNAYREVMAGQLASSWQPSSRPAGAEGRNVGGIAPTAEARAAGDELYRQAMIRLTDSRNPVTVERPQVSSVDDLPLKPGFWESVSNYAGPALSIWGNR